MENFIKKSKLVGSAFEVDHTDPSNVRLLTKIYFAARFESEILKMDLNSEENRKKVDGPSRTRYLLDIVQTGIHLLDSYLIDIFAIV